MKHIPWASVAAGFVTVLVGITSSAVIVLQAASAAGATQQQISSWMLALGFGMGLTCIGLSLRYRAPVVTAWSTPGAALLVTSLSGIPMAEAIGAFMFAAALVTVCGVTGWFERAMDKIPLSIAAAMLAGILANFGMNGKQIEDAVSPMLDIIRSQFQPGVRVHRVVTLTRETKIYEGQILPPGLDGRGYLSVKVGALNLGYHFSELQIAPASFSIAAKD